jgi:heat shock protein HslJ
MKAHFLILSFSLALVSKKCDQPTTTENLHTTWSLITFKNYSSKALSEKQAYLDLTKTTNASANMGCNQMGYDYKVKENSITFSNGIATEMYCQDMQLERDFCATIEKVTHFSFEKNWLILFTSIQEKLVFVKKK